MEIARRDFLGGVGVAAVGLGAASAFSMCGPAPASAAEKQAGEKNEADEAADPLTVITTPDAPITAVQDNVAYTKERDAEDPDYGARIVHVFGADSIKDYYLFDGFTGIGVYEKNDRILVRDLIVEPTGGTLGDVVLKDGSAGDVDSPICQVRTMTYTTSDGVPVQLKAQSLHGAQLVADGMVVYADNKPGKLARSVTLPLSLFDSELPHSLNYLLENPDSGKHNTSGDDDGFTETSLKFWYNEDDKVIEGPQHIYTKYAYNGQRNYWLYIESEFTVDVRYDKLGTGDPSSSDYIPGTSLNMSVREAVGGAHATVSAASSDPGRLGFSVSIDDTFYFDASDPKVVQNAKLSNNREFQFWKAELGEKNTALEGDVIVSTDLDCPGRVFFSVECDRVVPGDFELAVSVSAGRGTGWATEWSERPAVITVHVE